MAEDAYVAFQLPDRDVRPVDADAELETVTGILDELEASPPTAEAAFDFPLDDFGTITPWVAAQLGRYAELLASRGEPQQALVTAHVSANAALRSRDTPRLAANLLTLANIQQHMKSPDLAERTYLDVLTLPIDDGFWERAGAHMSLALLIGEREPHAAAMHYEQALCCLGERLPAGERKKIVAGMVGSYEALEDWVGLAYACWLLERGDVAAMLGNWITTGVDLSHALSADARLRRLGADALADRLRELWDRSHRGQP